MNKKEVIECQECVSYRSENDFYKIITERKNLETGEYEPYSICKECLIKDYFSYEASTYYKERIRYICEKYNLYYNLNISVDVIDNDNDTDVNKLKRYLKVISSCPQYKDKKYKDSVFTKAQSTREKINELSDIEFLDTDIRNIKLKLIKSLEKDDFNAHNKWMNSLRDALELREKLNTKENKYNIQIENINANNFDEILESIKKYQIKDNKNSR